MNAASHPNGPRNRSLRDAVQQFGFPIERFIPGRGASRALRLVGVADIVLGIGVAVWSHLTGRHWAWLVAGGGLMLSGAVVVLMARRISGGGVLICPRGLIIAKPGQVQSIPWDQMRSIAQPGATISIEHKDGTTFSLDGTAVGDLTRFGDALRRESSRRKVLWKT
jgi:hypothetical protein